MPYLKTETIKFPSKIKDTGVDAISVKVFINKDGVFYVNLDDKYECAIDEHTEPKDRDKSNTKIKILNSTFVDLINLLKDVFKTHYSPEIKEEPVIHYNIESHISFALDKDRNIYPSALHKGAEWCMEDMTSTKYGQHHASNPSKNGYSLKVGAKAKLKITYTYGSETRVEYKDYYKDGYHRGTNNPAELLNSWCSFTLDSYEEIPYSDDAALFFSNLMMGMAKLSKLIQDSTFDQKDLLKLIESGTNPMLPNLNKN